jgi:hypothetical protein
MAAQPKQKPEKIAEYQVYRDSSGNIKIVGDRVGRRWFCSGPNSDGQWCTGGCSEIEIQSWTYVTSIADLGQEK